jgi:hypothetical protein
LTGNVPITIKAEEVANIYRTTKDKENLQLDHKTAQTDWTYPADLQLDHKTAQTDWTYPADLQLDHETAQTDWTHPADLQLDHETAQTDWTHPADTVEICDFNDSKDYTIHIYTDGSKTRKWSRFRNSHIHR